MLRQLQNDAYSKYTAARLWIGNLEWSVPLQGLGCISTSVWGIYSRQPKKCILDLARLNHFLMRSILLCIVCLFLLGMNSAGTRVPMSKGQHNEPPIVLWAWERPEDLSFVDPERIGIAFLAGTVRIQRDTVLLDPRRQPLKIPAGSSPIAVVRIESTRQSLPGLKEKVKQDVAAAIVHIASSLKASRVQIDFDARVSERAFYRDLLEDVRKQLPDTVPLSITALASWCMQDAWMSGLPVDEAVPMLFRMGPEGRDVLHSLEKNGDFKEPICRRSVGLSIDEPPIRIPRGKRIYVFSPIAWTEASARRMLQEVSRWQ